MKWIQTIIVNKFNHVSLQLDPNYTFGRSAYLHIQHRKARKLVSFLFDFLNSLSFCRTTDLKPSSIYIRLKISPQETMQFAARFYSLIKQFRSLSIGVPHRNKGIRFHKNIIDLSSEGVVAHALNHPVMIISSYLHDLFT